MGILFLWIGVLPIEWWPRIEFGHELALAASLITSPDEAPLPEIDYDWLQLQSALHRLAIEWEIMDIREKIWLVVKPGDLAADVGELRKRFRCLADAPKLVDAKRFPPGPVIARVLEENRNCKREIEIRMVLELDRTSRYQAMLYELEETYQAWHTLSIARVDFNYVTTKRAALKRLLALLGPEAYGAAMMP